MFENLLNLHGIIKKTCVNGPGNRFIVQMQGCTLNCPGCFNPGTHPLEIRWLVTPEDLYERITHVTDIEGVSISGGEPTLQMGPLIRLLKLLRTDDYSIVLFSGRTKKEIMDLDKGEQLLTLVDILVDGPYIENLRTDSGIIGSSNQRIRFLTTRYKKKDIECLNKTNRTEIIIEPDGAMIITGFEPLKG